MSRCLQTFGLLLRIIFESIDIRTLTSEMPKRMLENKCSTLFEDYVAVILPHFDCDVVVDVVVVAVQVFRFCQNQTTNNLQRTFILLYIYLILLYVSSESNITLFRYSFDFSLFILPFHTETNEREKPHASDNIMFFFSYSFSAFFHLWICYLIWCNCRILSVTYSWDIFFLCVPIYQTMRNIIVAIFM